MNFVSGLINNLGYVFGGVCAAVVGYAVWELYGRKRPRVIFISGAPMIGLNEIIDPYVDKQNIRSPVVGCVHISQNDFITSGGDGSLVVDWESMRAAIVAKQNTLGIRCIIISGFMLSEDALEISADRKIHVRYDFPLDMGDEYIPSGFSDTDESEWFTLTSYPEVTFNLCMLRELEYTITQIKTYRGIEPDSETELHLRHSLMPMYYRFLPIYQHGDWAEFFVNVYGTRYTNEILTASLTEYL